MLTIYAIKYAVEISHFYDDIYVEIIAIYRTGEFSDSASFSYAVAQSIIARYAVRIASKNAYAMKQDAFIDAIITESVSHGRNRFTNAYAKNTLLPILKIAHKCWHIKR